MDRDKNDHILAGVTGRSRYITRYLLLLKPCHSLHLNATKVASSRLRSRVSIRFPTHRVSQSAGILGTTSWPYSRKNAKLRDESQPSSPSLSSTSVGGYELMIRSTTLLQLEHGYHRACARLSVIGAGTGSGITLSWIGPSLVPLLSVSGFMQCSGNTGGRIMLRYHSRRDLVG